MQKTVYAMFSLGAGGMSENENALLPAGTGKLQDSCCVNNDN